MSQTRTACFVVEGEFITETARRLWEVEDQPERALAILKTIRGLTEGQHLDILEGRSKLTGDSSAGIRLEPDKTKGRSLLDTIKKLKRERDEAIDERQDLAQMAIGDTVIVASPTGARRIPRRKAKIGGLSSQVATGLADDYEFDDLIEERSARFAPENRPLPTKKLRIWSQERDEYLRTKSRVREPEPEQEEVKRPDPPQPQDKITTDTGWLSPEGRFYPCLYAQHAQVAYALGLTDSPSNHGVDPAGWVRLSESNDRQNFFGEHTLFTEVQNQLIRDRCIELKIDEPWWLKNDAERIS